MQASNEVRRMTLRLATKVAVAQHLVRNEFQKVLIPSAEL